MTAYERWLRDAFAEVFQVDVVREWAAFPRTGIYSPRVDVAVGPFSVEEGSLGPGYDALVAKNHSQLAQLAALHHENTLAFDGSEIVPDLDDALARNWNARCLIAVEIENVNSRKHLLGSAVNASALGRVGLAVGWGQDQVNRFLRMRAYLRALGSLNKNTFDTTNLFVVSRDQLADLLVGWRVAPPPALT